MNRNTRKEVNDMADAPTKAPAKPKAAAAPKTYRPEQLAELLGLSGKIVRAYLRKTFTRPASAKGTSWVLTRAQAEQTLKHFKSLQPKDSK
jgi:hypothetical protein